MTDQEQLSQLQKQQIVNGHTVHGWGICIRCLGHGEIYEPPDNMADCPHEDCHEGFVKIGAASESARFHMAVFSKPLGDAFGPGIYYLIDNVGDVVYVGKSSCIMERIVHHHKDSKKEFERYHFVNAPNKSLMELELQEVIRYSPKFNMCLPENAIFASMGKLKALFRMPEWYILTEIKSNNIGHIEALGRKYYYLQSFNGILKPVGKE